MHEGALSTAFARNIRNSRSCCAVERVGAGGQDGRLATAGHQCPVLMHMAFCTWRRSRACELPSSCAAVLLAASILLSIALLLPRATQIRAEPSHGIPRRRCRRGVRV
eukprot:358478-Chlamydomonas_euryale.AAC.8